MSGGVPLWQRSATALAREIREGGLRSRQVVDAHIARVQFVNPTLNAVVQDRFEAAREEADRADAEWDRVQRVGGVLPPLHGVPCTIKEAFSFAGMPNTSGLPARIGREVTKDGVTVARLREAGAIPLGVTNTSELCMWMESTNRVYGRTSSAYSPRHTSGGSSGGEGAIIGAGGSPFGLGADIGGSIRMPAFFNGVFGHKGTARRIPNTGQYPVSEGAAQLLLCTGPLCRRAEDLMPLVRILEGPDGVDPNCEVMPQHSPGDVSMEGVVVHTLVTRGGPRMSASLAEALENSAEALVARGATRREIRMDALGKALPMWAAAMGDAAETSFGTLLGDGTEIGLFREWMRWWGGRSEHTFPALGLVGLERLEAFIMRFGDLSDGMLQLAEETRVELDKTLGPTGVLLYPPHWTTAPRHNRSLWLPVRWAHTALFNVLHSPVTQVPTGFDSEGLPTGVQVVGAQGSDHVTIAVALALEDALGGWTPPSQFGEDGAHPNGSR